MNFYLLSIYLVVFLCLQYLHNFGACSQNGAFIVWQHRLFTLLMMRDTDLLIRSIPLESNDVMVRACEEDDCNMVMGFAVHMVKGKNHQIDTRKQAIDPTIVVPLLSICSCSQYLFYGM